MKIEINHNTYQNWSYRRREFDSELYLNELVLFERLIPKGERRGTFYNVIKTYHRQLMKMEAREYLRYLKRRGIETSDDFYSYFHLFISRYQEVGRAKPLQDQFLKVKEDEKKAFLAIETKVFQKSTKRFRKAIFDKMIELKSQDPVEVMRHFCDELEEGKHFCIILTISSTGNM